MLSKVFHTHFLHNFNRWQGGFSQNESSAWSGTEFLNIEFAQEFDCSVAGGYAVFLQFDVLTFLWIWKIPCLGISVHCGFALELIEKLNEESF